MGQHPTCIILKRIMASNSKHLRTLIYLHTVCDEKFLIFFVPCDFCTPYCVQSSSDVHEYFFFYNNSRWASRLLCWHQALYYYYFSRTSKAEKSPHHQHHHCCKIITVPLWGDYTEKSFKSHYNTSRIPW